MEIIATTKGGCLIQATDKEVNEILQSVNGKKPDKLEIGQKIPAIDYAATITKIKSLNDDYNFKTLAGKVKDFSDQFGELKQAIIAAGKIDI